MYLTKMSCRENISYILPRDPSIKCWDDRVKLSGSRTKNLFQMGLDDVEETMGDNIKVFLRLKPSTSSENPYTVLDSNWIQTEAPKDSIAYKNVTNGIGKLIHKFSFTAVLDHNTCQATLFKKCAVKTLKKFLSGENYLIMAYGTTSAGKTYTMQGDVENPGVIPRGLDFVFTTLKDNIISLSTYQPFQYNEFLPLCDDMIRKNLAHKNIILSLDLTKCQKYPDSTLSSLQTMSSSGFSELYENVTFKKMQSNFGESFEVHLSSNQYAVWISMIEIYNEQVYDLLEFPNEKGVRPKLMFRDDEYGNTFVKNLRYVNVSSGHEAFQIFQFGRNNLHMAPTALNHTSSRSHCIFIITLAKFLDNEASPNAIISRFSFCDLAGMERAKKTFNVRDRLVESKAINTSLSILVKCLTTIKENQNSREKKMIPYRESKLTKLFRDAILGKEQFALIVNVTTESNLFDETLNVLKFSAIAQKIIPQNVFVKPKLMKRIKQSSFSRIVMNSTRNKTIDWDSNSLIESKVNVKEEKDNAVEELLAIIDTLKEDLAQERKRAENIECEIREELTNQFSEMLKKQRETNLSLLESETESLHVMYKRREKRLVQYYELLGRQNKRKRQEEEEEYLDEQLNYKDKLEELEKEVKLLRSENVALREKVQNLKEDNCKIIISNSDLEVKILEKDRVLELMKRANHANDAGGDALEKELRKQLEEATAKITEYKSLLDQAASDYKELEEQNTYLKTENEVLEKDLVENRETVADLRAEILELRKILSQKRIKIEKLEEINDKLIEELKTGKSTDDYKTPNGLQSEELEALREEFKLTSEALSHSKEEIEALKEEKKNMGTDGMKIANLEGVENINKDAEEELKLKVAELEMEIERLKEFEFEVENLSREKSEKCSELNAEIKMLQKELKDLIISNKMNVEKEKELDNLTKTNEIIQKELLNVKRKYGDAEKEMQKQIEELKTKESEMKTTIESLQMKLEAAEHQNSVLKNLKDKAEQEAYEMPELRERISQLEKVIESRGKELESLTQISNNYEKELSKIKEENERLRKDVLLANEVIEKNKTPLKTDKAEIRGLKQSIKKKDEEISKFEVEDNSMRSVDKEKKGSLKKKELVLEESSSKENSPFLNIKKKRNAKTDYSPEKICLKAMSFQHPEVKSAKKKLDLQNRTISSVANRKNGRKNKEEIEKSSESGEETEKENLPVGAMKSKCNKQLFTENDFPEEKGNNVITKKKELILEESSSKENSPLINIIKNGNSKTDYSPEILTKQIEALSIQQLEVKSTRKKVDLLQETIHPSTIKDRRTKGRKNGRKNKEKFEKASESEQETEKAAGKEDVLVSKSKSRCHKQLFTENDFDDLSDLNASPLEVEIPRLRPRK